MVVINPEQCIDCGVCVPECPIDAIIPDTEPDTEKWVKFNRDYSNKWPNITKKGPPPADADAWADVPNKLAEHFSPKPGKTNRR